MLPGYFTCCSYEPVIGEIPANIGELKSLRSIILFGNQISGWCTYIFMFVCVIRVANERIDSKFYRQVEEALQFYSEQQLLDR